MTVLDQWLERLESPESKQAYNAFKRIRNEEEASFCALGHMVDTISPDLWLAGMGYRNQDGEVFTSFSLKEDVIELLAGVLQDVTNVEELASVLVVANDVEKKPLPEIAQVIRDFMKEKEDE